MNRQEIAYAITDARYSEIPDGLDRETLAYEIGETLPGAIFEDGGQVKNRQAHALPAAHGFDARAIAMCLGEAVRQVVLDEDPAQMLDELVDEWAADQNPRLAAGHALQVALHSEVEVEPYTLGGVYKQLGTFGCIDLVEAVTELDACAGGFLRTFRSLTGMSRWEVGKLLGLRVREYGQGKSCATLVKWETGQSSPGRSSLRTLSRAARKLRRRREEVLDETD